MKKFLLFCCLIIAATTFAQSNYVPFDNPVDRAIVNDLFLDNQQATIFNVTSNISSTTIVNPVNYNLPEAIPWQGNNSNSLYNNIDHTSNLNFVNNTIKVDYNVVANPYNGFRYYQIE